VRVGNAAATQLQLDTYGEVMRALRAGRRHGLVGKGEAWPMQTKFIEHLEQIWDQPDDGIWEVRGGRRHFTHSKIMAWVAIDCTVRDAETFNMAGPIDRWRALRDHMHCVICDKGFSKKRNSFTQSFGSSDLDASLLLIPQVGFLPANDPRVISTVRAIEHDLLVDGWVLRYRTENGADGLPPGEGVFLPCSFWLATVYQQQGRGREALALFKRMLALRNDVGLLSEEYDPQTKRLVGNFPQAYSHLALVATARALDGSGWRLAPSRKGSPRDNREPG
jgi:GH15 family glucan-1,4-alpha-glucosidase